MGILLAGSMTRPRIFISTSMGNSVVGYGNASPTRLLGKLCVIRTGR
jgi:hypothetical protein